MSKPEKIAIALGGNQGDVAAAFRRAVGQLTAAGVADLRLSRAIATEPAGCAPGTPPFLNAALTGVWRGEAATLLAVCAGLEVAAGRPRRHGRNESRPLDLDLILFGDRIIRTPELTVPHPRARERVFVLSPLAEIAADWIFPDSGESVAAALAKLSAGNGGCTSGQAVI